MGEIRINKIVSYIDKASLVFDVACDHGQIGTKLLLTKRANQVYFSDISEKCLQKAKDRVSKLNLQDRAKFFCCDGIMESDADYVVVAGLGGKEIIKIISNSKFDKKIVLQPMTDVINLRKYLCENGYNILIDELINEGEEFFDFILTEKGNCSLSQEELLFGKTNITSHSDCFHKYLLLKRNYLHIALARAKRNMVKSNGEKLSAINEQLRFWEE